MKTTTVRMKILSAVSALVLSAFACSAFAAGDWVQDWFDQSSTTSPGSLQTQQRGYYTGGSFQARWRMSNEYPVSVSPPRFSAGCGGIDMFGGGFSFMDPEYLVQKLERAIQAAPAIAFQMAMSEYCKECTNAMNTMEQITDYLNSIQMNDCRLAKGIAAIPAKGDYSYFQEAGEKAMQGYTLLTGQGKNSQDVDDKVRSSGGKSPVDTSKAISECPAVFKTVFGGGSVVDNVTGLVSLSAYAPLMRGLIGDVQVTYDATYQNYQIATVGSCKGNDPADGFDFLTGKIEKKSSGTGGTCSVATSKSVQDQVSDRLYSIADKLKNSGAGGTALAPADSAFVNSAPFALLVMLRDAVKDNYVDEAITQSRDILATAYAAHMLNDVHVMARLVLSKADEVGNNAAISTTNPINCDTQFLKPAISAIRDMDEKAQVYRRMATENYTKAQTELNSNLAYAKFLHERRQQSVGNSTTGLR